MKVVSQDKWTRFKHTVTESAEETIGWSRGMHGEHWIQGKTLQLINECKIIKCQGEQIKMEKEQAETVTKYKSLNHKIIESCQAEKKEWLENKCARVQEVANKSDANILYCIV